MGGGWRNVNRKPTAFSRPTPWVGTALSARSVTKLLRPACGHRSGCRSLRNVSSAPKVISHWRIHSSIESPHCQCATSSRYFSASCIARSYFCRAATFSSTGKYGIISSPSTMPAARSITSDSGVAFTAGSPWISSGGSSCVLFPGISMYVRSLIQVPCLVISTQTNFFCFICSTNLCNYNKKSSYPADSRTLWTVNSPVTNGLAQRREQRPGLLQYVQPGPLTGVLGLIERDPLLVFRGVQEGYIRE